LLAGLAWLAVTTRLLTEATRLLTEATRLLTEAVRLLAIGARLAERPGLLRRDGHRVSPCDSSEWHLAGCQRHSVGIQGTVVCITWCLSRNNA
jgi:hypothetical protein